REPGRAARHQRAVRVLGRRFADRPAADRPTLRGGDDAARGGRVRTPDHLVDNTTDNRVSGPDWATVTDEQLLDRRMCDLGVSIEGTELERRIAEVDGELAARGLGFRPHYWLSDEWFTPDGVPGVAIPFYLAHPRLEKLELAQMLEVEGGDPRSCLRILRHEAGHAIDNAYRSEERRVGKAGNARC